MYSSVLLTSVSHDDGQFYGLMIPYCCMGIDHCVQHVTARDAYRVVSLGEGVKPACMIWT